MNVETQVHNKQANSQGSVVHNNETIADIVFLTSTIVYNLTIESNTLSYVCTHRKSHVPGFGNMSQSLKKRALRILSRLN